MVSATYPFVDTDRHGQTVHVLQIIPILKALFPGDLLAHFHVVLFSRLEVLRIYRKVRKRVAAYHWEVDALFLLLNLRNQLVPELGRFLHLGDNHLKRVVIFAFALTRSKAKGKSFVLWRHAGHRLPAAGSAPLVLFQLAAQGALHSLKFKAIVRRLDILEQFLVRKPKVLA